MKNRSIDEEFSRQLPDASAKDWKQLENQLEAGDLKRKLRGMLWAFPLAIVTLTGFSGWQSYELSHTRQRLEQLEKVVKLQKKLSPLDDRSDTVNQRMVVHDTVYLTTAIRYSQVFDREIIPELRNKPDDSSVPIDFQVATSPTKPSPNVKNFTSTESELKTEKELAVSSSNSNNKTIDVKVGSVENQQVMDKNQIEVKANPESRFIANQMPEQVSDSTLRAISEATVGMPDSEAKQEGVGERSNPAKESLVQSKTKEEKMVSEEKGPASTVNPESAEKSKQSKIRKSLPVSVDAGVSAGLLTPIAEGIEEGSRGTTAGLRFALNYSPRWSVVLDVQRNNLRFHQEGDHGYSFLPEVPTPFPGARLNEAEVYEFSSWQFGAGLQYTVLDKYSWKPYVRVGWALQKPANYLIEYKYIDANEDQSEAYYTFRNEPAIKDIVQGAVGVNYPLGQRLTASAEATYQRQWKTPTQTPNVMAFKATIVYRLSNN